ncbi:MAG: ATP-binding protein [Pirellulales bacterium]
MHPTPPITALVVEDDPDTRANLRDILELDDWRVETASTAGEVLRRSDWSAISVVILDRKLPDGSAEQLLPEISRLAPHAATIIVTGYADLDDAILALRQGAADYLLKPVNPDALRASMSRLVEQRRTEAALRESQQQLQRERDFAEQLIETVQTMVLLLDTAGKILSFNPYLTEVTGYQLNDVRGMDWVDLAVPPRYRAEVRQVLAELLARGQLSGYLSAVLTRSGNERFIQWSAKTLSDGQGNTIGVLASGQDFTNLKQAQERALQSERLAAIGQMMTGLAHESRNALQRSQACLEMLALEIEDRPAAVELVDRVQRAQKDLNTLYEEVRQYAAPIRLDREPTNLGHLWRETWSHLAAQHQPKNLRLCEEVGQVDLVCKIDRFAIGQVWRNILENAIQVSGERAVVTVRCAETTIDGAPAVQISFADEGPGMSADQRSRVFEPFFTTKTKGTGLGMAIAERIVSSHGGTIRAAERDGPGAEIVVALPRSSQ